MSLKEVKYLTRSWVKAGECGMQPLRDLERWVKGAAFHDYGIVSWEPQEDETWKDAMERMKNSPGQLEIKGELLDYRNHMEYWISYRQAGNPDAYGFSGPHMTPEDAAYSVLSGIEKYEREVYEDNLVIGVA